MGRRFLIRVPDYVIVRFSARKSVPCCGFFGRAFYRYFSRSRRKICFRNGNLRAGTIKVAKKKLYASWFVFKLDSPLAKWQNGISLSLSRRMLPLPVEILGKFEQPVPVKILVIHFPCFRFRADERNRDNTAALARLVYTRRETCST